MFIFRLLLSVSLCLFLSSLKAQQWKILDSIAIHIQAKKQQSNGDIDTLLSIVNDFHTNFSTQQNVLQQLKKNKKWSSPDWEKYRILDTAFVYYNNREPKKALPYLIKHTELAGDQVMSIEHSLGLIRWGFGNRHQEKIKYYEDRVDHYQKYGPRENIATCYHGIANAYYGLGNFNMAIRYYLKSSEVYKEFSAYYYSNELTVAGVAYKEWGNYSKAVEYLEKSIPITHEEKYYATEAYGLVNLIEIYRKQKQYEKAFQALEDINQVYMNNEIEIDIDFQQGKLIALQEKGRLFLDLNQFDEALQTFKVARSIADSLNISIFTSMGTFENDFDYFNYYRKTSQFSKAETSLMNALSLVDEEKLTSLEVEYLKEAMLFYDQIGEIEKSNNSSRRFINLSDSISSKNSLNLISAYEFEKLDAEKKNELNSLEIKRKENIFYFLLISIVLSLLAFGLFLGMLQSRKARKIINNEKQQSEKLLLNILPKKIANELKTTGSVSPELVQGATILFTDFVDFTLLAETLDSKDLVSEINICFSAFDDIIKKYDIEKIKTIGDSYMAVAGLHKSSPESAKNLVAASLEMQEFIIERKSIRDNERKFSFEMRVGLHTGSVTTGVVGKDKFQFDVWGDAVNIASRMESYGEPNLVNISHETYLAIKDESVFNFINRDSIEVKGKGDMKMYFVQKSTERNLSLAM